MSEIKNNSWIKNIICEHYTVKNQGVDLNRDGVISSSEKLPDFNRNDGLELGTTEDFWMFFESNKEQLAREVEFIEVAICLDADNPIHNALYQQQDNYQKIYDFIVQTTAQLNKMTSQEEQFAYLIDKRNFQQILKKSDSDFYFKLVESCAFEIDLDLFVLAYNKAADYVKQEQYTQAINLMNDTKPLVKDPDYVKRLQEVLFVSYYNKAIDQLNKNDYVQADRLIKEAAKNITSEEKRANVDNFQGVILRHQGLLEANNGNFLRAIELYQQALQHLNEQEYIENCQRGISIAYYNFANSKFQAQDYSAAIENYQQAINTTNDTKIIQDAQNMISSCYYNQAVNILNNKKANPAIYANIRNLLEESLSLINDQNKKDSIEKLLAEINKRLAEYMKK